MAESINDWNDLLPELLEKILSMVNDKETALSGRLVNSFWKAEMEKRMEKACRATWTHWKSPRISEPSPTALFTKLAIWKDRGEPATTASIGVIGKQASLIKSNCTPFPTKSVELTEGLPRKLARHAEFVPAYDFFNRHGTSVMNLKLQGVFFPEDIYQFLSWFPNLKGLLIPIGLESDGDKAFVKVNTHPPLPNLEHLEICKIQPTNLSREFVHWILDAYGANLVSLCLEGPNMFSLKENKKRATQGPSDVHPRYQKLAYLKVINPGGSFYKSPAAFPQLTHLVLWQIEADISLKGLRKIMDFIEKCAATLVHLHLHVIIGDLKNQDLAVLEKKPPQMFPKLTSFVIRSIFGKPDEATILKRAFLARFPALTKLEFNYEHDAIALIAKTFRTDDEFKHQMKTDVLGERFWDYAPKLQKISVCQLDNKRNVSELFTIKNNW